MWFPKSQQWHGVRVMTAAERVEARVALKKQTVISALCPLSSLTLCNTFPSALHCECLADGNHTVSDLYIFYHCPTLLELINHAHIITWEAKTQIEVPCPCPQADINVGTQCVFSCVQQMWFRKRQQPVQRKGVNSDHVIVPAVAVKTVMDPWRRRSWMLYCEAPAKLCTLEPGCKPCKCSIKLQALNNR